MGSLLVCLFAAKQCDEDEQDNDAAQDGGGVRRKSLPTDKNASKTINVIIVNPCAEIKKRRSGVFLATHPSLIV